jgi:hypothetical protein
VPGCIGRLSFTRLYLFDIRSIHGHIRQQREDDRTEGVRTRETATCRRNQGEKVRSTVTVITAARSHDLTTLTRAKRELGVSAEDHSRDADIREDITMASRMCAEYCGRPFGKETVREVVDYDSSRWQNRGWVVLQRKPIVALVSVAEGTDDALVLNTDFYVDTENGMIRRGTIGSPRYWRLGELTVEYTAGYELLDDVPWSYERACLIMLRSLWFSRGRDPAVREVVVQDVGERMYFPSDPSAFGMPLEVQQLLQPHRRML